jgi:Ca2+-binding RTX toxin-like protein
MTANLNAYRGFLGFAAFPKYWNALWEGNFLPGTFTSDNLIGSDKVDVIVGFSGDDTLIGKGGNDLLRGGLGSDRLDGGTGIDIADYTSLLLFGSAFGIDVNLSAGTVLESTVFGPETDLIANVEVIIGTASNDRFIGDGNNNTFIGNFEHGTKETTFGGLEGDSYSVTGDVAEYTGARQDFLLRGSAENFTVLGGETGIDTLIDVEFLKFDDPLLTTGEIGFLPAPTFDDVTALEVEITTNGSFADVYFPADGKDLPVVILLQGANVDKSNYSIFGSTIASYGFTVVVSNEFRTLTLAPGIEEPGLFASVNQIGEILDYLPASPVADFIDANNVLLSGHSFGGAAGLAALQGALLISMLISQEVWSFEGDAQQPIAITP